MDLKLAYRQNVDLLSKNELSTADPSNSMDEIVRFVTHANSQGFVCRSDGPSRARVDKDVVKQKLLAAKNERRRDMG